MNHTTLDDLLMDESFLAWYYHSDEAQENKWNRWIAASPENQLLAEQAVQWLTSLHAVQDRIEPTLSPATVDEIWAGIADGIRKKERSSRAAARPAFKLPMPSYRSTPQLFLVGSYFKTAWRHLTQSKMYSAINIFGLSMGMAVTMLIGLWIWDELSFNHYHQSHDRIAQVLQRYRGNGETGVGGNTPPVLAAALRANYGSHFRYVVVSSGNAQHNISSGDKKFSRNGNFMEPEGPDLFTLRMEKGTRSGLKDPHSILLCSSLAKGLFGDTDPMGKTLMIDNRVSVKVSGVYEDIPSGSDFNNMAWVGPWDLFTSEWDWVRDLKDSWNFNTFRTYVQLAPNSDFEKVSRDIKDLKRQKAPLADEGKADLLLFPMDRWHLFSDFKNGVSVGGQIKYVWLFGAIGIFVLLLACINFMNLSTARSEKRAKEVGIRKAIGSVRGQLIGQFLSESVMVTLISFSLCLLLVQLALPFFNDISDKDTKVLWTNPWFWLMGLGSTLLTGLIAGSYPAFYLSSFRPVKVLKGTFRLGRFAAVPRKVLVVVQFTVSVLLIAGTVIVFRQIQFAKNRPVGYDRSGLISISMTTTDIYKNYNVARTALLNAGVAAEVSESQGPLTDIWTGTGGVEWPGKAPGFEANFACIGGTAEYGKTIGWQIKEGHDFSTHLATDSQAVVLNEAAVKYMGLQHPVGQTIRWNKYPYVIIGVVKDIVMASPYEPVRQTLFYMTKDPGNFVNIKINPRLPTGEALARIGAIMQKYNPAAPFEYQFTDSEYAKKFGDEERIGKLAAVFANLAILISCLGLFGLASFMAEQRSKEVGIRKVLGATIFNLWKLLSKDFVTLVLFSCCIAIPLAWHFLDKWLQQYDYRTKITWDIFALVGGGALAVALLTVSYQAVKTALANPVIALKNNE